MIRLIPLLSRCSNATTPNVRLWHCQHVAGERKTQDEPLFSLREIELETHISYATLKRDARLGRLPGVHKDEFGRYIAPMPKPDSAYVNEWKAQPRSRARADIKANKVASSELALLQERLAHLQEQLTSMRERFEKAEGERVRLLETMLRDREQRDRKAD